MSAKRRGVKLHELQKTMLDELAHNAPALQQLDARTIIDNTTIGTAERELTRRGVYRCDLVLTKDGFFAHVTLHALRGPEEPATSSVHTTKAKSLAAALDRVCNELDSEQRRSICVFDQLGVLRGRYPNDPDGKRYADKHMRALGHGATLVRP